METKENGVLELYKAAHDAAFETLDMTTEGEIQSFAMEKFKAAGFSFRHDYNKFYTYLGDERIKMMKIHKETLPSKMNQATV
jgi:hypothetical protein